jgi:hypothetical protein
MMTYKESMKSLRKKLKISIKFFFIFLLLSGCLQKNESQYQFWKDFYSLQTGIKISSNNYNHLNALAGILSKEREKDFKSDENGNFYIDIAAQKTNDSWQILIYPSSYNRSDYYSHVTFTPTDWGDKEIYVVKRETKSHWNGYMPRDFFKWLNQFALLVNQHDEFLELKKKSPSFQFLCNTFACQTIEESKNILLEFAFSDATETKFPHFFEHMGSRLEKTKLEIRIYDQAHPEDQIIISNLGKVLQFRLPSNPRKEIFKNPNTIFISTNITIKSYGITFHLQDLLYRFKFQSNGNKDMLDGRFISFKSRKVTGHFLYFIPTGLIDIFIPGDIDQYLNDALTLLIHGTQGNGGSHFYANYIRDGKFQTNTIKTYSEILRNRFSLFGADSNHIEKPENDFFSQWEYHILKDLN